MLMSAHHGTESSSCVLYQPRRRDKHPTDSIEPHQAYSLQEKKLVMERKQSLKHTGIYINHDLTKLQQERSKKLREAKKVAIQRYQNQVVRIVKGKLCVDGQPLSSETFLTLCDNI